MAIYLTSDLHIGHENMIENGWRPFSTTAEMFEGIKANWNTAVASDDFVFILGDVVMGKRSENLPRLDELNGQKWLVPGNHDHCHPMHGEKRRLKWLLEYGKYMSILEVEDHCEEAFGVPVTLCHFPYDVDHTEEIRYPEWRPRNEGQWLVHGHLHSKSSMSPDRPRQIDVGMDAWNFTPVPIKTIAQLIKENS